MKRFLIILCCIFLVVIMAVPAFAATIYPEDYIVSESSNGDTSTLYISVPVDDLSIRLEVLNGNTYAEVQSTTNHELQVQFLSSVGKYWIGMQVFDKLDITDIVDGSTLNVKFNLDPDPSVAFAPTMGSTRYQVRYYDSAGNLLEGVKFYTVGSGLSFTDNALNLTIDKPEGAVAMSFIVQFLDITTSSNYTFKIGLESVNFICDVPTMVRVQQETGRTNKLLEKAMNGWEPNPTTPPFSGDMEDSINQEDQIIDQLDPDGVMGDLDDIQISVVDQILLHANAFQMISLIFEAFLSVPVLSVVTYVSLLLGLLAALLGIGVAAGRAASRHESRSGKRGK